MEVVNHTPFPAIGWPNLNKDNQEYITTILRVKYLFDKVDDEGQWSLKLDPEQGELFMKDVYYDEDIVNSSVRFESDFVTYKPQADLIINAHAHSPVPAREWRCGVKVLRPTESNKLPFETLIEKWLRVRGERYIQQDVIGFSFTSSKESRKVPLRYEYANGGHIVNPDFDKEHDDPKKEFLIYALYNPVGVGVVHKAQFLDDTPQRAPQIESMNESIDKPNMPNPAQGFGFIVRTWHPRVNYVGTFTEEQLQKKEPCLPKDFQEIYYNAAHPDLQLKSYFKPDDKVILYNLSKDKWEYSFKIPNFYFKTQIEDFLDSNPIFLDIDTVIVDILEDDMAKNAIYISYRTRMPASKDIALINLNMLVPEEFTTRVTDGR